MIIELIIAGMMSDPALRFPVNMKYGHSIHDRMALFGADKWIKPLKDLGQSCASLHERQWSEYSQLSANAKWWQRDRRRYYTSWRMTVEHCDMADSAVKGLLAAQCLRLHSGHELEWLRHVEGLATSA